MPDVLIRRIVYRLWVDGGMLGFGEFDKSILNNGRDSCEEMVLFASIDAMTAF